MNSGRGGKGSIYVWAGGNGRGSGDNCNYDGYANSRFTIAIGAVDYLVRFFFLRLTPPPPPILSSSPNVSMQGKQSYYSENCAALLACAPSSGSARSITTTDLTGNQGTYVKI